MREMFVARRFSKSNMAMIEIINNILDDYQKDGFRLSLRQLYYQLVARDYIPNTQRSYKNIGTLVSNARQAGRIDWGMIEDRNRETVIPTHWDSPASIVEAAAQQFKVDKWENQPCHIEVMVEKDALSGVLGPVCYQLDIGITANKGYSSSSTMYEIGKRLSEKADDGKEIYIIYLGDHDPSGIDMTRDVRERLELYSGLYRGDLKVVRLALNWEQVELWQPPENPAKETDARYAAYVSEYGGSSWELDAVEPGQLAELVRSFVGKLRDDDAWEASVKEERSMKSELRAFVDQYQEK